MSDEPEITVHSDEESLLPSEIFHREFCYSTIRKLRAEITASKDPARGAYLCYAIGWLFERYLGDRQQATTHYQEALGKDPDLVPAIRALRRRAMGQGNWSRYVELVDREIELTREPLFRAQLRVEKAEVMDSQLDEPTIAQEELQMALEDDSDNQQALWCLENLHRSRHNLVDLTETLDRISASLPEGPLRQSLLYEKARLEEVGLDDVAAATEDYQALVASENADPRGRAALRRLYVRSGDLRRLVKDLRQEADSLEGRDRARTLYTVARILNDRMGEMVEAIGTLEEALEADPESSLVLAELVRLYPLVGKLEQLAQCYRQQIRLSEDTREKAALYLRLGQLYDEQLRDDSMAEEAFRDALAQDPENRPTLAALAVFYQRRERFDDLVALHFQEAEDTESPMRRALAYHRGAEILEDREDLERAKHSYRKALEALPTFVPSFNALEQLLERTGDHEGLVELLTDRAQREDNPVLKARLIERTARIIEERMGDKEGAVASYKQILDIDPTSRSAIGALVRLTRELQLWQDHVEAMLMEADMSEDEQNVVSVLLRVGEIQESRLEDEMAAVDTYQRLMSVDPFYPPALRNLGRIYYRNRMFEELINLHRQELDFTTEPDEKSLLHYKIGKLFEERLDDLDEAAGAYKASLMENPRNFAATWALYRIYLKREDWLSIIDILEAEANALPAGPQRALALVRVGDLWAEVLDREDMATDAYMQALRTHAGCTEAREALIRLSEKEGNWDYLADLLYQQLQTSVDEGQQYRLAMQLGELTLDRMNNPYRAMEWYMKALALDPTSVAALRGTEHALRAAGEWKSFLEVRRKLMRRAADEQTSLALFHGVQMLRQLHGRKLGEATEGSLLPLEDLEFAAQGVLSDLMLEREILDHGDPGARLRFFETRLASEKIPLSVRLADGFDRAEALLAAGMTDEALDALDEITQEDAAALLALLLMERIAESAGDEARLVQAATRLGDEFERPAFKAESLVKRGVARLGSDTDRAAGIEDLHEALSLDPENGQAFFALVQAMGADGEWAQLASFIEKLAEKVRSKERTVELFGTLANLQWRHLDEPLDAIKSYNRVLKHDATHAPTLMSLVDLYTEQGQPNDAIAVCRHLLSSSPDDAVLAEAAVKLADLLDHTDMDTSEVEDTLTSILAGDPQNGAVLQRLARLRRKNGDTKGALEIIDRMAGTEQDPVQRSALLCDQAELLAESGGDEAAVLDLLDRALEDDPGQERALVRLMEMMHGQKRHEQLAARIRTQIDRLDEDSDHVRAMLLTRLGTIYRDHLGQEEKAALTLREAFELDPACSETGLMLVDGLVASDRFGDGLQVCERMLEQQTLCMEAFTRLVVVLEELGEKTRAALVAQVPVYFGIQDDRSTKLAAELRKATGSEPLGVLTDEDLSRIRVDEVDHPARDILELLGQVGSKALRRELGAYGIERGDRLSGKEEQGKLLVAECAKAAKLLGVKDYEAYLVPSRDSEITVQMHKPPALLFSVTVTELSEVEQRILAVQALSQVRLRTAPAQKLPASELEELFMAAARLFRPDFGQDVTGVRRVQDLQDELDQALTKKQRKALEPLVNSYCEGGWLDFEEWHHQMNATAMRLSLVAAGDLGSVLDAVKKRDPVLIGVPLTGAQSRREAFEKSELAMDLVRFILDAETVELWKRYVAKL